jgi:transcription initiation factor TFIID subunit 13
MNDDDAALPLESPTSGEASRPKRRKVETERMREARETEQLERAMDEDVEDERVPVELAVAAGVEEEGGEEEEEEEAEEEEDEDEEEGEAGGAGAKRVAAAAATEPAPTRNIGEATAAVKDNDNDAPYQPPVNDDRPEIPSSEREREAPLALYDDEEYHSDKPPKHALQGTFLKDLIPMMIGFGDDESPALATVEFVEDALVGYSVDILKSALDLSKQRGRIRSTGRPTGPPTAEDILTVVRKDPRKVARVEELLIMQQEIKVAQDSIEKQEDLEGLAIEHEGS